MAQAPDDTTTSTLGRLRQALLGQAWEWDGRFGCALTTVSGSESDTHRSALMTCLAHEWGPQNISGAPAEVKSIAASGGGLRGGQFLFTADAANEVVIFVLWWPWGGGNKVSLRLGIAGGPPEAEAQLRAAFGL